MSLGKMVSVMLEWIVKLIFDNHEIYGMVIYDLKERKNKWEI
jgi:hypothetical protein